MPTISAKDIEGYTPLIDVRRQANPTIVNGRNFYMSADGPVSGFSRALVESYGFADPQGIQSFDIDLFNETRYCTIHGIFKYDPMTGNVIPVYELPVSLTGVHPWTTAEVGGKQYFARRNLGYIIEYDPNTGKWVSLSGGSYPADIRAITQSGGRLIVLGVGLVAWSAIDDATDIIPSTSTGAGFQSLSLLGATKTEDPLMVFEYSNGFLTYTTQGIMVSELVQLANPFRHRPLSRKHAPLNEWAITQFGDFQHVFVSRQGLFQTKGGEPEIFIPLLSEYLHDTEVPALDKSYKTVLRLSYDDTRQWFFIHIADQPADFLFNRAYMIYLPTQRVGLFNRTHYSIVRAETETDEDVGFKIGYVGDDGHLYRFSASSSDLGEPTSTPLTFIIENRLTPEIPAMDFGVGGVVFSSWGQLLEGPRENVPAVHGYYNLWGEVANTPSPTEFLDLTETPAEADIFRSDAQFVTAFITHEVQVAPFTPEGLDSYVEVGVIRGPTAEQLPDHLSFITEVGVHALNGVPGDVFEDWLNDFPTDVFEDWLAIADGTADEDWGEGSASTSVFTLKLRGTLDGRSTWQGQEKTAIQTVLDGAYTNWTSYVTGLYHILRFEANDAGESFVIKALDIDVRQGGVLL